MELDHLFICVDDLAVGDLLLEFGLTEGSPNRHPGQGTACRRFFFHNAFIELLFLENEAEAQSSITAPTRLYERFVQSAVPFGVCFRPEKSDVEIADFPTWDYQPAYLPDTLSVHVAEVSLAEPMWFYLPFACAPVAASADRLQPFHQPLGLTQLDRLAIAMPFDQPMSESCSIVARHPQIDIEESPDAVLTLYFDSCWEKNFQALKHQDFRPDLPLIIHW